MQFTCDVFPFLDEAGRLGVNVSWPSSAFGDFCKHEFDNQVKFFAQRKFSREVTDSGVVKWTREESSVTIKTSDGLVVTANIHDLLENAEATKTSLVRDDT